MILYLALAALVVAAPKLVALALAAIDGHEDRLDAIEDGLGSL